MTRLIIRDKDGTIIAESENGVEWTRRAPGEVATVELAEEERAVPHIEETRTLLLAGGIFRAERPDGSGQYSTDCKSWVDDLPPEP